MYTIVSMYRRIFAVIIIAVIAGISGYMLLGGEANHNSEKQNESNTTTKPRSNEENKPEEKAFDKSARSIDDPASIWVVVNKQRPLQPTSYAPDDLVVPSMQLRSNITNEERLVRAAVARALEAMATAASGEGHTLTLESGYRSYNFQKNLYNRYVRQQGQATADTQSARPGHSEHQTGLVADIGGTIRPSCNVEPCFADTPEGIWMAKNAHIYGFIVRYPKSKTGTTGYIYEPWHIRYVGKDLAAEMQKQGMPTMEEFFGLPPAPDYN